MPDGFRNILFSGSVPVKGINIGGTFSIPVSAVTQDDLSPFDSIMVILYATGASGGAAGLLELALNWFDVTFSGSPQFIDTIEINFDTVSGFAGRRAYFVSPVMGAVLQIVSGSGTTPPTSPTLNITVIGLTTRIYHAICWQEQDLSRSTDLLAIGKAGGAISSGGSVGPFNSGLASGPVFIHVNVAFTTGAAVAGKARLRMTFGSASGPIGWPDLIVDQGGVNNALGVSTYTLAYMPRRPVICTLADIASGTHNTINSYQFSIIRDER